MNYEQYYYDVLRDIAKGAYTSGQIKRRAERAWALDPNEALEMAYDNLQAMAAQAIKGKRRPRE